MLRKISGRFNSFLYNFGWSGYVPYIDGWIPRFSLFVPIIGYLIIFSDQIGGAINFANLSGASSTYGLTGQDRLRFVYFGLFALGASNLLYRIRRPYIFRHGTNENEFARTALEHFTFGDFLSFHHQIRHQGHYTLNGKYYDSEWDGFVAAGSNPGEGTENVQRTRHWENAKSQYGSLLRSILAETFFRENSKKKVSLVVCVILSTLGYVLLAIPSADLFIKVVLSTVQLPVLHGGG